jgi:recombination protein RecT
MTKSTKEVAKVEETTVTTNEQPKLSATERFTSKVLTEYQAMSGNELELTNAQRRLISNYFLKLDSVLTDSETKRMKKPEQFRDALVFSWGNINMNKLAQDVVAFSSIGLDPQEANHIFLIPYKNNTTNKYDITFMMGYRGIEIKAKKYGLETPDSVICELVYSTDKFKSIKKSFSNPIENYEFEITNEFNRGEIVGGFYYHIYKSNPEKNKLKVYSSKDIEKRKPDYASAEFWGGEKDNWENGKKVGKVETDGWRTEMYYKTLLRAAYNDITIDSMKIDEHYQTILQSENESSSNRIKDNMEKEVNIKNATKTFEYEEAVEVKDEVSPSQMSLLDVPEVNVETPKKEVVDMPPFMNNAGEE